MSQLQAKEINEARGVLNEALIRASGTVCDRGKTTLSRIWSRTNKSVRVPRQYLPAPVVGTPYTIRRNTYNFLTVSFVCLVSACHGLSKWALFASRMICRGVLIDIAVMLGAHPIGLARRFCNSDASVQTARIFDCTERRSSLLIR